MPAAKPKASRTAKRPLIRRLVEDARALREGLAGNEHADDIAQAAACAAPILAGKVAESEQALAWLAGQLDTWEQESLQLAKARSAPYEGWAMPGVAAVDAERNTVGTAYATAHLYDEFLAQYLAKSRKRHGVYFTPPEIAGYIVNEIDALLKTDLQLPGGLAYQSAIGNPQSAIVLLDPACGTGIFLLAALDHLHRHVTNWQAFVPHLLPRLIGIEILPAAALLAKLNLTLKLAATGYKFRPADGLQILTADALDPDLQFAIRNLKPPLPNRPSAIRNPQSIPVLLGNPPFSSLTTNTNPWIADLVRGTDEIPGYAKANGQRLGERKTWLHDDYVKFIRLAQWHVEEAGCGIVGFVTNHGYLDNATFRLMRHELLRVFQHVRIVDLHGGRKKYEQSPDGSKDENVFGLDQGTAIGLFRKPPTHARRASEGNEQTILEHADLWGDCESKLAALQSNQLQFASLQTTAPDWLLIPKQSTATPQPEYDSAWSLADAMPISTPAPVTARDHFVVAFTREELLERVAAFRDLRIPDDEIRARYFQRTRSGRYQTGDTRGWKLSEARRRLAAEENWQSLITRCLYRPFDWRYVFWHPAMIDWPREAVTRDLIHHSTVERGAGSAEQADHQSALGAPSSALCLIARRQQLPTQPCTFFWVSDGLALDGVIRSDNRGSESLFPLYVMAHARGAPGGRGSGRAFRNQQLTANFAPEFIEEICRATGLAWQPLGRSELKASLGPDNLAAYIYALFHAPSYRECYASQLRRDFPRIIPPRSGEQFVAMSRLGERFIDLHLLRSLPSDLRPPGSDLGPASACDFRVGGYQVLRKWLQPSHRTATDPQYVRIASAVAETERLMQEIDRAFVGAAVELYPP